MWRLTAPKTSGLLSWMGVSYVLVHIDAYERSNDVEFVNERRKIVARDINGLKFIKQMGDVDVYRVVAEPVVP